MRILAHRGLPGPDRIENTVAAVQAALSAGADGVELDLRLTADGVLAGCHDASLQRVAGSPLEVAYSPWAALQRHAGRAGVPLARMEELLTAAEGARVVLELKSSPAPRGRVVSAVVDDVVLMQAAGTPLDVTISSFDAALIRLVRIALPVELGIRTALLGRPGCRSSTVLRQARAGGHRQIHPHVTDLLAEPCVTAAAASLGIDVVPWTVNSRRAVRKCAELGVAAVITDRPRHALTALAARTVAA